jgi:hypothetical protein
MGTLTIVSLALNVGLLITLIVVLRFVFKMWR